MLKDLVTQLEGIAHVCPFLQWHMTVLRGWESETNVILMLF